MGLLLRLIFETVFQLAQCLQALAFVLANPALVDLMQRRRIEVVQLLAPMPQRDDEIGLLEQCEVLGDGLPRHVETGTQFPQRLAVLCIQPVQQLPPAGVGERLQRLFDV